MQFKLLQTANSTFQKLICQTLLKQIQHQDMPLLFTLAATQMQMLTLAWLTQQTMQMLDLF